MVLQLYLKTDWILDDSRKLQLVFLDVIMHHNYVFYMLIFQIRYYISLSEIYNKIQIKKQENKYIYTPVHPC